MTAASHALQIEVLNNGRLARLTDWNEQVAEQLASHEGITLGNDHWQVINSMRDYYRQYNVSPVLKLLKRNLARQFGPGKFDHNYLNSLFPEGVLDQCSKIAGVPMPLLDAELERNTCSPRPAPGSSGTGNSVEFKGRNYPLAKTGNLLDPQLWNEELAHFMAAREDIELGEDHWEVLNFLRKFYFDYGVAPMVKILMKHMSEELGAERASRERLYTLFPGGPSRQGSRLAGLPEPQGCIDG